MTPFDSYIRILYTSKRNKIYYKSSSTNISDHHQTYTYALQIKIHMDLKYITDILDNYQTSRGTQFNWHLSSYISEYFTPINAIKYIKIFFNKHFGSPSNIHLPSTNQNLHGSQINCRHFRQLSDFSRNPIKFNTFRFIYQNTLHL